MQPDITLPKPKVYKEYTALLTQEGTAAPTATVLQNTTGEQITWTRTNAGVYVGTMENEILDENKTTIIVNSYNGCTYGQVLTADSIFINTFNPTTNAFGDELLYYSPIEIKLYS